MPKIARISKSPADTADIAQDFLKHLEGVKPASKKAIVVGLYGELGAGKTTFTIAAGKAFKIKRKLNSPTFVIMKRYALKHKTFNNLFHLDAYRLKKVKELLHLGWKEIIADPKNIIFIEWPEKVAKAMPKKHHKIKISHTKEGHRHFKLS